jgi:hypothetical protein
MRHEILFSARMAAATQRRTKKHFSAASRLLMRFFLSARRDANDAEKNIKALLRGSATPARVNLFFTQNNKAAEKNQKHFSAAPREFIYLSHAWPQQRRDIQNHFSTALRELTSFSPKTTKPRPGGAKTSPGSAAGNGDEPSLTVIRKRSRLPQSRLPSLASALLQTFSRSIFPVNLSPVIIIAGVIAE